jgi:hypothetical protein
MITTVMIVRHKCGYCANGVPCPVAKTVSVVLNSMRINGKPVLNSIENEFYWPINWIIGCTKNNSVTACMNQRSNLIMMVGTSNQYQRV